MKISKHQLIEMNVGKSGLNRFIEQTDNTDKPVEIASLVGGQNTSSDLIWLAGEILSKEKVVRFDCDVALINIDKIKPYTDKKDLIVSFLKNPTADAAAAYAAAAAALAAADTAALSAADAALAAADADTAAAAEALAAADAAAADAAAALAAYAAALATAYIADAARTADADAEALAAYAAALAADAVAAARAAGASQEQINALLVKLFKDC